MAHKQRTRSYRVDLPKVQLTHYRVLQTSEKYLQLAVIDAKTMLEKRIYVPRSAVELRVSGTQFWLEEWLVKSRNIFV